MNGFGAITWWGFSPALDLQKEINSAKETNELHSSEPAQDVNILIIGAADLRHVLKTLADANKHKSRKLNIYIIENNIEVFCRQMLFLKLLSEPAMIMGLQEKSEYFLEIFGNTLIRFQTSDYIEMTALDCIKMVTNLDYQMEKLPFLDISLLKFKERDAMESIFKFWRNVDSHPFDISNFWDARLRHYLGTRYDAKDNIFDWEYNMKLLERNASVINCKEYKHWRRTGIAFELREADYTASNRTLASNIKFKQNGETSIRCGYHGDIVTGPYISFGIESECQDLFQKTNGIHRKTSQDVSSYNILSYFDTIMNESNFINDDENESCMEDDCNNKLANWISKRTAITFLTLEYFTKIHQKEKFQQFFQVIFVSNSLLHTLTKKLSSIFAENASLIVETAKYLLDVRKEQLEEVCTQIIQTFTSLGFEVSIIILIL
nr:dynein axonemal assembly factor 3-like protein [Scolopendra mutilans]